MIKGELPAVYPSVIAELFFCDGDYIFEWEGCLFEQEGCSIWSEKGYLFRVRRVICLSEMGSLFERDG
jgi:hypothetical protein